MALKVSLCLLALIVNITSTSEYSGLLSRLYKKAANEHRPLILVLDNSDKDLDDSRITKPKEVSLDRDSPLNLLELLNQKHLPLKLEHKHNVQLNRPLYEEHDGEPSYQQSDLQRLRYRLKKEREMQREKKERRERRERFRSQDKEEQDRDNRPQDKDDRSQYTKRDRLYRYQNKNQEQSQDREDQRYNEKRALRSSVIKNLLRTYNDLNCDAKDECQDECGEKFNGKKLNNCEQKCEVKYDCDEEKEEEDPCAEKDACDESEETGSTRGERLVTVTEKCKRC